MVLSTHKTACILIVMLLLTYPFCNVIAQDYSLIVHSHSGGVVGIPCNEIDSVQFGDSKASYQDLLGRLPYTIIQPVFQGTVITAKINCDTVEIKLENVADRLFYYKGIDGESHYCHAGNLIDNQNNIFISIPHDYIFGWDIATDNYFLQDSDEFFEAKKGRNDYIPLYYNWTTGGYGALYDYVNEVLQNRTLNNVQQALQDLPAIDPGTNQALLQSPTKNFIHSCSRCGYTGYGAPFQSKAAFVDAYKKGFDMILCDLQFTSDDVPVLEHDYYLNQYYIGVTTLDGMPLPSTEEESQRIYIAETTYEELLKYDFSRNSPNAERTPICTLVDFLTIVKLLGIDGIVELKTRITEEQTQMICRMVRQHNLSEHIWWAGDDAEQLQYFNKYLPDCHLLLATPLFEYYYPDFVNLKTENNQLAVRFPFLGTDPTLEKEPVIDDYIDSFIDNNILLQIGTVNSPSVIDSWFERGALANYLWCVRSDSMVASIYIRDRLLEP